MPDFGSQTVTLRLTLGVFDADPDSTLANSKVPLTLSVFDEGLTLTLMVAVLRARSVPMTTRNLLSQVAPPSFIPVPPILPP